MVKVGPRPKSPSRRELIKAERERKRAERLASCQPVGEPIENLWKLYHATRPRGKKLGTLQLGDRLKQREKRLTQRELRGTRGVGSPTGTATPPNKTSPRGSFAGTAIPVEGLPLPAPSSVASEPTPKAESASASQVSEAKDVLSVGRDSTSELTSGGGDAITLGSGSPKRMPEEGGSALEPESSVASSSTPLEKTQRAQGTETRVSKQAIPLLGSSVRECGPPNEEVHPIARPGVSFVDMKSQLASTYYDAILRGIPPPRSTFTLREARRRAQQSIMLASQSSSRSASRASIFSERIDQPPMTSSTYVPPASNDATYKRAKTSVPVVDKDRRAAPTLRIVRSSALAEEAISDQPNPERVSNSVPVSNASSDDRQTGTDRVVVSVHGVQHAGHKVMPGGFGFHTASYPGHPKGTPVQESPSRMASDCVTSASASGGKNGSKIGGEWTPRVDGDMGAGGGSAKSPQEPATEYGTLLPAFTLKGALTGSSPRESGEGHREQHGISTSAWPQAFSALPDTPPGNMVPGCKAPPSTPADEVYLLGRLLKRGTPPFYFHLIPVFGTPRNITIPSSAFSNGRGTFSTQVPLNRGQEVVFAMSDSTGWNAGGTSSVLTVGASKGGSCDTTQPQVPFSFQLNTALQQCRPFTFSAYTAATLPVTIYAIVPGGNSLVFNPPPGPTDFSWTANVARGTSMIFMLVDSQGRQGGSSDIMIVGNSDDNTCLNSQSPSSTANAPAPGTQTGTATTSGTSTSTSSPTTTSNPDGNKKSSVAGVVGGVIGGLVLLGVVISLLLFFLKKRKAEAATTAPASSPWTAPAPAYSNYGGQGNQSEVHLTYEHSSLGNSPYGSANRYPYSPNTPGHPYDANPFADASTTALPHNATSPSSLYNPPTPYADSPAGNYQVPPSGAYPMSSQYPHPPVTYPPQPAAQQVAAQHTVAPTDPFQGRPTSIPESDFDPYAMDAMAPPSAPASASPQESTSASQRKNAVAGSSSGYKPSRFIMHTDAEDDFPPPNEDGVVELPPSYSERRAPNVHVPGPSGKGPLP